MTEVPSFDRNTQRLKALWPHAMFLPDWLDLWREDFQYKNQQFLAEAMADVKRKFSSHQPELKWFHEAFRDRLRASSATVQQPERDRHAELEAELEQLQRDDDMMRRQLLAAGPETWERIRQRLRKGVLASVADGMQGDPTLWSRWTLGMAWAALQRYPEVRSGTLVPQPERS